jgi:hypothetical protein
MNDTPADIAALRDWFPLIRRLQQVSNSGPCVVSVQVLVDDLGLPVVWANPRAVRLEPKYRAEDVLRNIMEQLSKDGGPEYT